MSFTQQVVSFERNNNRPEPRLYINAIGSSATRLCLTIAEDSVEHSLQDGAYAYAYAEEAQEDSAASN